MDSVRSKRGRADQREEKVFKETDSGQAGYEGRAIRGRSSRSPLIAPVLRVIDSVGSKPNRASRQS